MFEILEYEWEQEIYSTVHLLFYFKNRDKKKYQIFFLFSFFLILAYQRHFLFFT